MTWAECNSTLNAYIFYKMFNNKTNKQRPTKNTEKNNKKPNQTPKNPPSKQPKNKQQQKHSKEEEYWCKTWGLRKELDKSDSTEWMWFKKKGFRIKRKILFISCSLMCSERDKIEYWFLERYDYALKIIKKKKKLQVNNERIDHQAVLELWAIF